MPHFGDYQNEIYANGLRGTLPTLPVDFALLERMAESVMPLSVRTYVQGGCGDEWTQQQNSSAFHHWGLIPRMLGRLLRPATIHNPLWSSASLAHLHEPDRGKWDLYSRRSRATLHAARASAIMGVPLMVSTLANDPLEVVAAN